MKEILIDVTAQIWRRSRGVLPTGIERVELEYIRHFKERSTALIRFWGQWVELSYKDSQEVFNALLDFSDTGYFPSILSKIIKAFPRSIGNRFLKPCFYFSIGYSSLNTPSYIKKLLKSQLKPLFLIHDMIPLSHPECFRLGEAENHKRKLQTIFQAGYGIITATNVVTSDLKNYALKRQLTLPSLITTLLAPAGLPLPSLKAPLDKPYFVMLSTIEPRKNHWLMLQLWKQLIEQFGEAAPRLVIIGQRGWECENVIDLLERSQILKGFVIECPKCRDAELATWLKHARALLFPTFAEGYGMPLVEALSVGTPAIVSDLAVFREIAQDVPEYVDPLDAMRWMELITDYTQPDSRKRQQQCERIATYKVPTWKEHFEKVDAFLASF